MTYWDGLLIVELNAIDISNGFKKTPLEVIRISPNKAKSLAYELSEFKKYINDKNTKIDPNKGFGVAAGSGDPINFIAFSCIDNENREVKVTIGRINNSGNVISSQDMIIDNPGAMFGLEWKDINNMNPDNTERVIVEHIELDMFMDAVNDFANHMNGAIAYSVVDLARYEANKNIKRFDAIFDKLGIERITPSANKSSSGNSFLNNLAAKNSSQLQSFDSLEDMLND